MGTRLGHALTIMIVRFRQRKDRFPHIEFDWEEGLIILRRLKYFPQYQTVYVGKAQNGYTKHWYEMYDIKPELNEIMLKACREKFGQEEALDKNVFIPGTVKEGLPHKELEVNTDGDVWQGEEWCQKWYKCSVKQYSERFSRPIRQKG